MPNPRRVLSSFLAPVRRFVPRRFRERDPVVAVVRLNGVIGPVSPLRQSLTLASLAPALQAAFETKRARAVALLVNSPGGSAVQSHFIFKRIRALADEHNVPVYVFAEDVAASGGYMIALAADEIFADQSSIVGSIGVVAAGFGFDKLIGRFGIDRRVYTAGEEKAMLDPFQPEKEDDVNRLKRVQAGIHVHFIELVKSRRGARLKGVDGDLFTGAFWSAPEALALGLVDGIGDVRAVMRQRFGEKVKLRLIERPRSLSLARLFGSGSGGATWSDPQSVLGVIEARVLWQRYGL